MFSSFQITQQARPEQQAAHGQHRTSTAAASATAEHQRSRTRVCNDCQKEKSSNSFPYHMHMINCEHIPRVCQRCLSEDVELQISMNPSGSDLKCSECSGTLTRDAIWHLAMRFPAWLKILDKWDSTSQLLDNQDETRGDHEEQEIGLPDHGPSTACWKNCPIFFRADEPSWGVVGDDAICKNCHARFCFRCFAVYDWILRYGPKKHGPNCLHHPDTQTPAQQHKPLQAQQMEAERQEISTEQDPDLSERAAQAYMSQTGNWLLNEAAQLKQDASDLPPNQMMVVPAWLVRQLPRTGELGRRWILQRSEVYERWFDAEGQFWRLIPNQTQSEAPSHQDNNVQGSQMLEQAGQE